MRHRFLLAIGCSGLFAAAACGAEVISNQSSGSASGSASSAAASSSSTGAGTGAAGSGGAGGSTTATGTGTGGNPSPCPSAPDEDKDGDGFTPATGDCNDCDPKINPAALEIIVTAPDADGGIPAPVDEDCDGLVDEIEATCDDSLSPGDVDPLSAAAAIDLCHTASPNDATSWGVLSAAYVGAAGGARAPGLQTGLLDGFGANVFVQKGKRLLALSSGRARDLSAPMAEQCGGPSCATANDGPPPAFYPQDSPLCDGASDIHDDIALEVTLRAPSNVSGFSYLYKFHSFAFPEWVCSPKNDQFAVLMTPPPPGSINGNIAFDTQGNPLVTNLTWFDVCDPGGIADFAKLCTAGANCPTPPFPYCSSGADELAGTGFAEWGDGAATSWLKNLAPIKPGEVFTLRFAIWDTGDHDQDSTVLLDGFAWIVGGSQVPVYPDPEPK